MTETHNAKAKKKVVPMVLALLLIVVLCSSSIADTTPTTTAPATTPTSTTTTPGTTPASTTTTAPGASSTASGSTTFRFVVLPDTHVKNGKDGMMAPARKAVEKIANEIKPAFVLHTGDMIDIEYKKGTQQIDAMWSMFKKGMLDPILNADSRFFPSAGNHDIHTASAKYVEFWRSFENRGFQVTGPSGYTSYYSFDFGNAHFVSLYVPGTQILGGKAKEQREWLKQDFASAKQRGKSLFFVFAHSPVLCSEKRKDRCGSSDLYIKDKEVFDLLKEYKATFFGGHMHIEEDRIKDGVRSIVDGQLGGGGGAFSFLVVDVEGTNFKVNKISWPSMDCTALPKVPAASFPQFAGATGTTGATQCPAGYTATTVTPSTTPGTTPGGATTVSTATADMFIGKGRGCIKGDGVAIIGDSISWHGSYANYKGFVKLLQEQCPGVVFNGKKPLTEPGVTTDYMLRVLKSNVLGKGYKQLIIMGGVNNILSPLANQNKAEIITKDLSEIYCLAKKDGMTVIAMTITPLGGGKLMKPEKQIELDKVNSWIVSKPQCVDVVINTYKALGDPSKTDTMLKENHVQDYIHPNYMGHKRMFDVLALAAFPKPLTV
ncbi:TPA: hypothetical protein HA265_01195 [Candidatus Woesearchaeota archaeon]|nr:hypothetical protein [Candidatus Woesearchaeota archaeon]